MERIKLDGEIVKNVSRSFYLTLRLLPREMREVISLGYLLARASDTIADTAAVSMDVRTDALSLYVNDVKRGAVSEELSHLIKGHFVNQRHDGENVLMRHLKEVVSALSMCDSHEHRLLLHVTETITNGQIWDLSYFKGEGITSVKESAELEEYTYKVAGCVGEFWTEILALNGYVREEDLKEMRELGVNYGKGLQLTNIVRDIAEDYENGRIYIPVGEESLSAVISAADPWIEKAQSYLRNGEEYTRFLPNGRLKVATLLPSRLGIKTLDLIAEAPYEERKGKVKIEKKTVFQELLKAFIY